jgi:hypothetical protein
VTMELPLPSGVALLSAGQVFWLSAQSARDSLPIRVGPDSGRADAPSLTVPDHSGGSAPDLHRVPGCQADVFLLHSIHQNIRQGKPPAYKRLKSQALKLIVELPDNICFLLPAFL